MNARRLIVPALFTLFAPAAFAACGAATITPAVRKDIEVQMATAQKPIAFCYETALKKNPDISGKMVVKFRVADTSRVPTFVEVTSAEIRSPELEKCVVTETQEVRLSSPPGVPIAVTYPLEFAHATK